MQKVEQGGVNLMNAKKKLNLWGRNISLSVEYDCYTGEEVLPEQEAALNGLVNDWQIVENTKKAVIDYCMMRDEEKIAEKSAIDIFKYVTPKSLFIARDKKCNRVYLMCDYLFNEDDGIAVEFIDGKFSKVGSQSII